jgi:ribosomal protein S18 acetylase RimI-like enzyme
VAADRAGVAGYILGALDTQAFEQRLERDWWPALRARYPDARQLPGVRSTLEHLCLQAIHEPFTADPQLASRYPSQLHIDLLPRLQGRGLGRRMMNTLFGALRAGGSRGVHLHVSGANQRAIGFYQHIGMAELPAVRLPAVGVRVFTMPFAEVSPADVS